MKYMLDTNICIFILRNCNQAVRRHFKSITFGDLSVSVITVAELELGVRKSVDPEQMECLLQDFLGPLETIPFTVEDTLIYGGVRANLEKEGTPIGPLDTLIASHALSRNLVLVTNNVKEFSRVKELAIEDWTK